MCQLWGHVHPAVEEGRHGALPLQRLRALPQDERHQPAPVQTPEEAGKSRTHTWGEEEAKKPQPAGDAGVFQLNLPKLSKQAGFSHAWDTPRVCTAQSSSPETQPGSGRGCRTQGDFGIWGVSSAKSSLCFSITAGKFGKMATLQFQHSTSPFSLIHRGPWSLLGEPLTSW